MGVCRGVPPPACVTCVCRAHLFHTYVAGFVAAVSHAALEEGNMKSVLQQQHSRTIADFSTLPDLHHRCPQLARLLATHEAIGKQVSIGQGHLMTCRGYVAVCRRACRGAGTHNRCIQGFTCTVPKKSSQMLACVATWHTHIRRGLSHRLVAEACRAGLSRTLLVARRTALLQALCRGKTPGSPLHT